VRFGTYGRGIWDFVLCDPTSPEPVAAFAAVANQALISFQNTSSNSYFHQWDFGDGATAATRNTSHTFAFPGTYTVRLIAQNFCGADTLEQVVSLGVTGVDPGLQPSDFHLFPNPTSGNFFITNQGETKTALQLELGNIDGRIVWKESLFSFQRGETRAFSLPALASGMYFVTLREKEGSVLLRSRLLLQ
jgi:hypothetical protein